MAIVSTATTLGALPCSADQEPQTFSSQVSLVTVDVVVTDGHGRPVSGLVASDFRVTEEGRPQSIVTFRAIGSSLTSSERRPAESDTTSTGLSAPTFHDSAAGGATFVIVFDDLHLQPLQTKAAVSAIEGFVANRVVSSDTLVLVAPDAGVHVVSRDGTDRLGLLAVLRRLEGRKIVDPCQRLTEFEAMRSALGSDDVTTRRPSRFRENTACPGGSSMDAAAIHRESQHRDKVALDALTAVLQTLDDTGGKRSVLLVSGGFIEDPTLQEATRSLLRNALRLQAVLYFIDVRGLVGFFETEKTGGAVSLAEESAGAERLAQDTGGFSIHDTNGVAGGMDRIAGEGRAYYLIGYSPGDSAKGTGFRRIKVRVESLA